MNGDIFFRFENQPEIDISEQVVDIQPGDDITRGMWRFERLIMGVALEQSNAYRVFAGINNILNPFQFASDRYELHWIAPTKDRELLHATDETEFSVDLFAPAQSILVIEQIENELPYNEIEIRMENEPDTYVFDRPERQISIRQLDNNTVRFDVSIPASTPVETRIKIRKYPFIPRPMNLPLEEQVAAGARLEVREYPWQPSREG